MIDEVCVIGAGVSGLTAMKALGAAGVSYVAYEKGSDIGGMWRYENDNGVSSAYRSLHIDSSRQSLAWPDFRLGDDLPEYPSHIHMSAHFERYAEAHGLRDRIAFRREVTRVEPTVDAWEVATRPFGADGPAETRRFRAVVVANGHLWDPRYPDFPGAFSGETIHSHHYRTADPYEGKRVLVVGLGNSAVDIAVDLSRRAARTVISTRRSAWILPKYLLGHPTDRVLGYMTRRLRLPVKAARAIAGRLARLTYGRQERFGLPLPAHPIWREHATISQDLLPALGHGRIVAKPNVAALDGRSVRFEDGTAEAFDAIVYATGYRISFPFIPEDVFQVETRPPPLYRRIVAAEAPAGLYFAGLLQPIGPTIPLVEVQARWIAAVLSGRLSLPGAAEMKAEVEAHRDYVRRVYLGSARYALEVDGLSYRKALEADLGR